VDGSILRVDREGVDRFQTLKRPENEAQSFQEG